MELLAELVGWIGGIVVAALGKIGGIVMAASVGIGAILAVVFRTWLKSRW